MLWKETRFKSIWLRINFLSYFSQILMDFAHILFILKLLLRSLRYSVHDPYHLGSPLFPRSWTLLNLMRTLVSPPSSHGQVGSKALALVQWTSFCKEIIVVIYDMTLWLPLGSMYVRVRVDFQRRKTLRAKEEISSISMTLHLLISGTKEEQNT